MTIRRDDDVIFLEEICGVEDSEALLQELQVGATLLDWGSCTHLHTACLQLMMAATLPVRGPPEDTALTRWVAPMFKLRTAPKSRPEPLQPLPLEV